VSIRSELNNRLSVLATSLALPLCLENTKFTKPLGNAPFLEMFIIPAATLDVTVDGTRQRQVGIMQINVWCPVGNGTKQTDDIVAAIKTSFPLVPKQGSVSIENTPSEKQAILDPSGYRITPIIIPYRMES
jgi:hypothetical protein